jgi:hypothetical protein
LSRITTTRSGRPWLPPRRRPQSPRSASRPTKVYPHSGDLSVKQGGYEIDVGIADFTDDNAKVDAAALTLMKLVLPQL